MSVNTIEVSLLVFYCFKSTESDSSIPKHASAPGVLLHISALVEIAVVALIEVGDGYIKRTAKDIIAVP